MRRAPYTTLGIRRVPCHRCGKPSSAQWSVCALGSQYLGVCARCDVALNRTVLRFFGVAGAERIITEYAKRS